MNENQLLEKLDSYLSGVLSAEESQNLEIEIKSDLALQQELEILKIAKEAVELSAWKTLIAESQQEYLAELNDTPVRTIHSSNSGMGIWLGRIAASLTVLLVGAASVLVLSTSPNSITDNQVDYVLPVLRSSEFQLAELEKAYQNQDYNQVLAVGKTLDTYDAQGYLLIGLAHLERNEWEAATEYFLKIEQENQIRSGSDYADQVDYYLVKAYLLQGNTDSAQLRMEKILDDSNHTYHDNFGMMDTWRMKILKAIK
jgi:hypothetical protein